jgi:hypothetical protein
MVVLVMMAVLSLTEAFRKANFKFSFCYSFKTNSVLRAPREHLHVVVV